MQPEQRVTEARAAPRILTQTVSPERSGFATILIAALSHEGTRHCITDVTALSTHTAAYNPHFGQI